MPLAGAGSDELIVTIPGKEPLVIPVLLDSGGPQKIAIRLDESAGLPGNVQGVLSLMDAA